MVARHYWLGAGRVRTKVDALLQRLQGVGNDLRALMLGLPHQLHGEYRRAVPLQEVLRVVLLPTPACNANGPRS